MVRVLAFGTFDVLHTGHLYYLEQARRFGNELVVVVARDKTVQKLKGKKPLYDERTRLRLVQALKPVTRAVLGQDYFEDKFKIVKKLKPHVIVLGYDQKVSADRIRAELKKRGLNINVTRARAFNPKKLKSSKIRGQLEKLDGLLKGVKMDSVEL